LRRKGGRREGSKKGKLQAVCKTVREGEKVVIDVPWINGVEKKGGGH